MPELPEVETITNALKSKIMYKKIINVDIFFPKLRYDLTFHHQKEIFNSPIVDIRRRARYTIIELENLNTIILHYGMTGSVRICQKSEPRKKHEHVTIQFDDETQLRFDDPRRFGFVQHEKIERKGENPVYFEKFGPEPFDEIFDENYLFSKFKNKETAIKLAIMDNAIVVGVGNIYANETLFITKINPQTPVKKLSKTILKKLIFNIREVLKNAIKAGGTTISDFKGVDGQEGKFVQQLTIYGKVGEKCSSCGTIIEKIQQGGRSTFFCPQCQKK